MKLSELETGKATEILCEITPYVAALVTDEELIEELRNVVDPKNVKTRAELLLAGLDKINKIVPILLKKRKAEIYGILGVLNGKTADDIARQNFLVTLKQIKEIIKDKELIDFFK